MNFISCKGNLQQTRKKLKYLFQEELNKNFCYANEKFSCKGNLNSLTIDEDIFYYF